MDEEFSSALLTGCVLLASSCWALPCKTRRAIRPPHADQPAARGEPAAHRLPPTNDPGVHPAYPGRPRGRAGHAQPPPDDDGQVQPTPRLAQQRLRQLRAPGSNVGQRTSRAWTQRATTPTLAIPAVRRPAHAALQDLTSAGHSARGNAQTPDADTGRRTADTWTLRRPHRTLDSGPVDRQAWTLVGRTGHRTLAEDVDRVTKARPASGPPGPPRRATARWDAQPCSCGRRLGRSTAHAGSAVRPPSSAR
jgi:hypothetical protein